LCNIKLTVYVTNLRTLGGNQSYHSAKKRSVGDFDFLYVLTDENVSYLIPDDVIKSPNAVNLGTAMDKYIIIFKLLAS